MSEAITNGLPKEQIGFPQLTIRAATKVEELYRVIWTIYKLPFYHEHQHKVVLPNNPFINNFLNLPQFYQYAENIIAAQYGKGVDYQHGVRKLEEARPKIEQAFPIFKQFNKAWDFHLLPHYKILLTKYGSGGSYLTNTRLILVRLSNELIGNTDVAEIPIHEMTHIGVEKFVQQYSLNQDEKEGLVDGICLTAFKDLLPGYKTNPKFADKVMLSYVTPQALENIPAMLGRFVAGHHAP